MKIAPLSVNASNFLHSLAESWTQKYPALKSRTERGLEIALTPGAVRHDGQNRFFVSSSRGGDQVVEIDAGVARCSCEDSKYRTQLRCKHILAAALMITCEARFPQVPLSVTSADLAAQGGQYAPCPPREVGAAPRRGLTVRASSAELERVCRRAEEKNAQAVAAIPETPVIPISAAKKVRDPRSISSEELFAALG